MLKQIVKDYSVVSPLTTIPQSPRGNSCSPKGLILHILESNSGAVEVLDIGFGVGDLALGLKQNADTRHWSIDGIDGFEANCHNADLFGKRLYRNIWHGLAQELPSDTIAKYKIICLLDVIEHLTAESAKWLLQFLLTNMGEQSFLFISTPLWFYPQDNIQEGDLEEHLIGVPASSMMALAPLMYSIRNPLIGGFVLGKSSLELVDLFHPISDKKFSYERGLRVAKAVGMNCQSGMLCRL